LLNFKENVFYLFEAANYPDYTSVLFASYIVPSVLQ